MGGRALYYVLVRHVKSVDDARQELEAVGIDSFKQPIAIGKSWKFQFAEKTTFLVNKFKKVKLSDDIIAVYGIRQGKRTGKYNSQSTDILNKYGNIQIKSITLVRTPISNLIDKGINVISNNVWNELKIKYGYDVLYHLGMICEVGTKRILIEKNDTPNISLSFIQDSTSEFFSLKLDCKDLTLIKMLDVTRDVIGDDKFFVFDGFRQQNCQDFIHDILDANEVLTNDASKWIYQPIDKIINEIPEYVPVITKVLTDIKKWIWLMFENPWLAFYKLISFILEFCLIIYRNIFT